MKVFVKPQHRVGESGLQERGLGLNPWSVVIADMPVTGSVALSLIRRCWTYIPHFAGRISGEFPALAPKRLSGATVVVEGYVEQSQHLELQFAEIGLEHFDGCTLGEQGVALGEAEQAQDVFGGRSATGATLRV